MNKPTQEFLDPSKPLVSEVVAWLCGDSRFPGRLEVCDGAHSLAHIMVVVPTSQSGRNLRVSLAKEAARRGWGGILPPKVVLPMQLVRPSDETVRDADDAELAAAFLKFSESRPMRHVEAFDGEERVVVDEWTHLFRSDAIRDMRARLSLFDQLCDIWRALAGGGLLMRDVLKSEDARSALEAAGGGETERWQELADLEDAFFDFLHGHGLRHPSESVSMAKSAPAQIPVYTKEVVLPALADPIGVLADVLGGQRPGLRITALLHASESDADRFDAYGRPVPERWIGRARPVLGGLRNEDIVLASDTASLARRVSEEFPPAGEGFAVPSLAVVDGEMFPEVSAAFLNAGYVVHNPERHMLAVSSLGRLVRALSDLYKPGPDGMPWSAFESVLRSDDVLKALQPECRAARADVLCGVDFVQNRFLPKTVRLDGTFPDIQVSRRDEVAYNAFLAASRTLVSWLETARACGTLAWYLRSILGRVFSARPLGDGVGDSEFREAASCVRNMLDGLSSESIASLGLSGPAYGALARRMLDNAFYSLEPDSPDAVKTEGWLELPWSLGGRFALVGLHEGSAPDSVVGHPFLPDQLRCRLGLSSNERRLARDTWILGELLASHEPHAVRAYVARANGQGDICRPSRLLYLCGDEDLPGRIGGLFGDCASESERFPRMVADGWRMRLPDEVPLPGRDANTPEGRLSASAIDQYLKCPFTYLLKYALGMKKVEEKFELGFDDFGTLLHRVLERYAYDQISRGDAQLSDASSIRAALDEIFDGIRVDYGERPSVNLGLQLDALAGRLSLFAEVQSEWASQGWRIVEKPEYHFCVQPFLDCNENVWIKGSIDRIDFHPDFGYRIIDYKSWDKKDEVTRRHIASGGARQLEFANVLRLPLFRGRGDHRLLTVQLPLYARCLELADAKFAGKVFDMCYLVLGEDADNIGVYGSCQDQGRFRCQKSGEVCLSDVSSVALETALVAIRRIRDGLFWPPGPGDEWKYDVRDLFVVSPQKDFGADADEKSEWLARQLAKLERLGGRQ